MLDLGRKHRVRTEIFLFEIALEKCLERDRGRPRPAGPRFIEEQYRLYRQARESVRSEGFDEIVELHEEDLQSVRFEVLYRPVNPITFDNKLNNRRRASFPAPVSEPRS